MTTTATRAFPLWVLAGMTLVVVWRVSAYFLPSSFIILSEPLQIPTLLLGLLFLSSGVITLNRAPSPAAFGVRRLLPG